MAWSLYPAPLSPWMQAAQEGSEFSEAAPWSWGWPWRSWPYSRLLAGRSVQRTYTFPLPLSAFYSWGSHSDNQSLFHKVPTRTPTAPAFYRGSKRAVKNTDIKPFLIHDTSTQETQKEMMDAEKRELEREVPINLGLEITKHSRKWVGLFLRWLGSKLDCTTSSDYLHLPSTFYLSVFLKFE